MERPDSVDDHLDRWVPLLSSFRKRGLAEYELLVADPRMSADRRRRRRLNELLHRLLLAAENPEATSR